ncbi:hypothetical protein SANTM175S_06660 [Streptomyces antimycoticus]
MEVSRCITELQGAEEAVGREPVTPLAQELADHGDARLMVLEALLDRAQQALQRVGLSADPTSWQADICSTRALQDGIAQRWQQLWDSIRNASQRAQQNHDEIAAASFLEVEIPRLSESEEKELLIAGRNLEQHVLRTGKLNTRWPRPAVVSESPIPPWNSAVEGMAPDRPEHITAVVRQLEMRAHARTLRGQSMASDRPSYRTPPN